MLCFFDSKAVCQTNQPPASILNSLTVPPGQARIRRTAGERCWDRLAKSQKKFGESFQATRSCFGWAGHKLRILMSLKKAAPPGKAIGFLEIYRFYRIIYLFIYHKSASLQDRENERLPTPIGDRAGPLRSRRQASAGAGVRDRAKNESRGFLAPLSAEDLAEVS